MNKKTKTAAEGRKQHKTLADGRKPGSGRKKGSTGIKHKKPDIAVRVVIKSITLDATKQFGPQLAPLRKYHGITMEELAQKIGCHSSNIGHIEHGRGTFKKPGTAFDFTCRYARALGVKEIKFKL